MRVFASLAFGVSAMVVAVPTIAQDLNTLNRHLEHQQWQRLQDHQNRSRSMPPRKRGSSAERPRLPACTQDHVPRSVYKQMEAEYHRKVRVDGKRLADQWSRSQADAWYERLKQQGICR